MDALYGTTDFKTFDDQPDYTKPKSKVKRKKTSGTKREEDQLQKNIVKWFGMQYPHIEPFLAYNLNNSRNRISGAINKAMGVRAGRNDMSLDYRGRSLLLELKAKGKKQSDEQVEYQQLCNKYGNFYRVADNFDDATQIIRKFIAWCDR